MIRINKTNKGQASFVLVLVLGLVSIVTVLASSSLSVNNVIIEDTISSKNKAWYAAWAGVDELMYRLRAKQTFGPFFQVSLSLENGATVSAQISGDNYQKTVLSQGYAEGIVKNLEIKVASSSSKASFIFAAQSGTGGFEMENGAKVTGANGTDGNVYSNGNVLGTSSSYGSGGSKITGGVWAVGYIGGLNSPDTGGVNIKKNAWASALTACSVGGSIKSPVTPSNCSYAGQFIFSDPPQATVLSTVDIEYWKNIAQSGGVWNGDCNVRSGNTTDCTHGTGDLGNIKIVGNLTSNNGVRMKLVGPVWVKGNIVFSNNVIVDTDNSSGTNSIVMVASDPDSLSVNGKIEMSNNVVFNRNSFGAGAILISENTSVECTDPAITLSNNASSVVLIALNGCIYIRENAIVNGVIANKIHLTQNATVNYDPSLARAILESENGGWRVVNVKEY